jgi:hypothetical protein
MLLAPLRPASAVLAVRGVVAGRSGLLIDSDPWTMTVGSRGRKPYRVVQVLTRKQACTNGNRISLQSDWISVHVLGWQLGTIMLFLT